MNNFKLAQLQVTCMTTSSWACLPQCTYHCKFWVLVQIYRHKGDWYSHRDQQCIEHILLNVLHQLIL